MKGNGKLRSNKVRTHTSDRASRASALLQLLRGWAVVGWARAAAVVGGRVIGAKAKSAAEAGRGGRAVLASDIGRSATTAYFLITL